MILLDVCNRADISDLSALVLGGLGVRRFLFCGRLVIVVAKSFNAIFNLQVEVGNAVEFDVLPVS